jgi:hypothetical protein
MTIFDFLNDELEISERILRDGKVVITRFRIFTPEGQFVIFVPLADDSRERDRRMGLIAGFMAWRMALGFVLSAELEAPDAITSFVVTRSERRGIMRRINRGAAISFGATEELDAQNAGDDLLAMLPARESAITFEQQRELERVFGEGGEMPAQRVR